MTEKTRLPPELSPFDEIRFVEHHRPNLEAGDYDITVKQKVGVEGAEQSFDKTPFKKTTYFSVSGDRFDLHSEVVHAVFPPAGSRGNYWHHFPHVILNRSTLPWERSACDAFKKDKRPPWLALLLFDQSELAGIDRQVVELRSLKKENYKDKACWADITEESSQHDDDQVVVIDVPWDTLKGLLPENHNDFRYRTHSRRVVPPELAIRVHQCKGKVNDLTLKLKQKWTQGPLAELFANEGIALGNPAATEWTERKEGGIWQFSDPEAGNFEVRHHQESFQQMEVTGKVHRDFPARRFVIGTGDFELHDELEQGRTENNFELRLLKQFLVDQIKKLAGEPDNSEAGPEASFHLQRELEFWHSHAMLAESAADGFSAIDPGLGSQSRLKITTTLGSLQWLKINGGPVPATGTADAGLQHNFVAFDGDLTSWAEWLDGDVLPIELTSFLKTCGLDPGGNPQVTTQKLHECWRLVDETSQQHHMIQAQLEADRFDVYGYGKPSAELATVIGNRLPASALRSTSSRLRTVTSNQVTIARFLILEPEIKFVW